MKDQIRFEIQRSDDNGHNWRPAGFELQASKTDARALLSDIRRQSSPKVRYRFAEIAVCGDCLPDMPEHQAMLCATLRNVEWEGTR